MEKRKFSFLADEDDKYEQEYQKNLADKEKLKEAELKKSLANKGKQGVSMVSGNISPIVGENITYHIADWYPDTPNRDRNPAKVTWELFKKRKNGKFTTTNIKKVGVSSFTFGEVAWQNTYRLEAYLYKSEGGGLIINPKPSKIPKIGKVEFHYVDDEKGDTFSFRDKLRAKAHTTNLIGKDLIFTLWEDDVKGKGHNANNKAIDSKPAKVDDNGLAIAEFMLTKALIEKALQGEADAKQLEFYVTVEYYIGKKHDSENVNINNPLYKAPEKKSVQTKAKDSPAEQKPISKKEEKGIIGISMESLWDWAESKGKALKDLEIRLPKIEGKSMVEVASPKKEVQKDDKVCECEARVRAFLRLIMVKESEEVANKQGYSPYEINVGGKSFIQDYKKDYSTHPRVYVSSANSTAAGAYQFLGWKYDEMNGYEINKDTYKKTGKYIEEKDYIKKYNIKDFSPISQDKLCLANLKHYKSGVISALLNNDINKALDIASYEWASLPHNNPNYKTKTEWRYPGQHGQTLEKARANYEKFLKEELQGETKYLRLEKGFLKEFGYHCCEENTPVKNTLSDGKWRMPIDNPMLCMYSQGGGHKPWHGSFGENIRDGSANHTGNDLLAIPGTKVYACLKGIIHKIYTSTSMAGNVVVLKVTDKETFKNLRNSSYAPKYKNKGELLERSFDHNGTIYLTFWHLSKNDFFKEGDEVKYNDVIGLTGISGWSGRNFTTRNPHLHFEISNIGSAPGLAHKCNPSVYFKFKTEDELTPTEVNFQNNLKEKEWK